MSLPEVTSCEAEQEHFFVLMFDHSYGAPHEPRYAAKNTVAGDSYRPLGGHSPAGATKYTDMTKLTTAAYGFLKSKFAVKRKIKSLRIIEVRSVLVTTETPGKQVFRSGMDLVERIGQIPTDEAAAS